MTLSPGRQLRPVFVGVVAGLAGIFLPRREDRLCRLAPLSELGLGELVAGVRRIVADLVLELLLLIVPERIELGRPLRRAVLVHRLALLRRHPVVGAAVEVVG